MKQIDLVALTACGLTKCDWLGFTRPRRLKWNQRAQVGVDLLVGLTIATAATLAQAVDNYAAGQCVIATTDNGAEIYPTSTGGTYLFEYRGSDPRYAQKLAEGQFFKGAIVRLLKSPSHGQVELDGGQRNAAERNLYRYTPDKGYVGNDRFVMQITKDAVSLRIEYLVEVIDEWPPGKDVCRPEHWKISVAPVIDKPS